MPTTKKRKKEEKGQTIGITAFLVEEEEEKKEAKTVEPKAKTSTTAQTLNKAESVETTVQKTDTERKSVAVEKVEEDVENICQKIVDVIKKRGGKITKDELFAWAKLKGIKLSTLMKAVEELSKRKVIVRRIIDEKLCYELKAS